MDQLIPVMNRLQEALSTCEVPGLLSLPQIVVVGSQSSGKSSVLESIVGRDFLPRGTGIVTRRPLILQCVKSVGEDYAEFGHLQGAFYKNFEDVREEIQQVTNDLVGSNKAISSVPINLKIYSSRVVDITLVDLPGLVVNPVGDQPPDIEARVREMILNFITPTNSLILAITPANVDIATSEAIKIARKVDPNGERTLAVLTKLDCMGSGEDATDLLEGRVLPLRLGYVGVICRSQADIVQNVKIEDHLVKEAAFFSNHPTYKRIANRLGTPYLSTRLNHLLINHICEKMPLLKRNIADLLRQKEDELLSYGEPLSGKEVKMSYIFNFIDKFCLAYNDSIDGRSVHKIIEELKGGSRIKYIFNEMFRKTLNEIDPFSSLSDREIRTAMMNAGGARGNLFIPEMAFELLVKHQIEKLLSPSLDCIHLVFDELRSLVASIEMPELERFENLRDEITEVVGSVLSASLIPTQEMVNNLVKIETSYINTQHPDFIKGSEALQAAQAEYDSMLAAQLAPQASPPPVVVPKKNDKAGGFFGWFGGSPSQVSSGSFEDISDNPRSRPSVPPVLRANDDPSQRDLIETIVIKKLIESYFFIVRKNIADTVPKTIIAFLVNKSKESLRGKLTYTLYKEEKLDHLLRESGAMYEKRLKCLEAVAQLRAAHKVLNEVNDLRVRD